MVKLHGAASRSFMQLQSLPTIRQHSELVGPAEGALGADVQVDGGEAVVVPRVIRLCSGHVQVPRYLRHEPAAVPLLEDEVGELVDEPAVGESCREERLLQTKKKIMLISDTV